MTLVSQRSPPMQNLPHGSNSPAPLPRPQASISGFRSPGANSWSSGSSFSDHEKGSIYNFDVKDVATLLAENDLGQCSSLMELNMISGATFAELDKEALQMLGIDDPIHRCKIMGLVNKVKMKYKS